ncbi:hypothetical protein TanjilG_28715 [Lupinus angustifolius]|uniref:Uncharacterized protein n=1 Tax=Lupinus angustifolius TaxID=3871 RepID=A0A1J7HCM0_LUPAN|nr:hypothetical protein TanjilG_28715 [Lupinus angustifolius]
MTGEDEKEAVGSVVHPTHHHLLKPKNHAAQPRPEAKTLPYLTDRAMETPPPLAKSHPNEDAYFSRCRRHEWYLCHRQTASRSGSLS